MGCKRHKAVQQVVSAVSIIDEQQVHEMVHLVKMHLAKMQLGVHHSFAGL